MSDLTIGIIGFGLIGGAIGKTIKKVHPNYKIIAYNRSKQPLLDGYNDKIIDLILDEIDEKLYECDIIFLCTPVEYNIFYLEKLKPFLNPNTILTDVGSVKGDIHLAIEKLDLTGQFIGGHPMAGSEKTGYANSSATLYNNAFYALTPTANTNKDKLDILIQFVKDLGANPLIIDYNEHDYTVAGISHLPHLLASSLVNLVKDNDTTKEHMRLIAAGGFKDITRIASASPEVWEQICMSNKENISLLLEKYINSLCELKEKLESSDSEYIHDIFIKSKEYRDTFN